MVKPLIKNSLSTNIFWLFFDKVYGALLSLIIYSLIARYFGVELFGIWNYILAIGSMIPAVAGLGLNLVIVKKLKENSTLQNIILSNSIYLRFFSGLLATILFFLIYAFIGINAKSEYLFVALLVFISQVILNTNIFIYKNEADLKNKKTVIARNIALSIGFLLRLFGIKSQLGLLFFAFINVFEYTLFFVISYIYFIKGGENKILRNLNKKVSSSLVKQGLPLMLAAITVTLYLKIDQLIIAFLLDNKNVGIYAAASRITEMFYAIPVIISNVFFPRIVELNRKALSLIQILRKMYGVVLLCTIFTALCISFFASDIIEIMYGKEYISSSDILVIYAWSLVFMGLLLSSSKYLIATNRSHIILKRELMGMGSNVFLNFFLIPKYGLLGAAIATLVSYSIASFFSTLFFKEIRPMMKEQLFSIFYLAKSLVQKTR